MISPMAQAMTFSLFLLLSFSTMSKAAYNIIDLGAKPDGRTDAAEPLLRAWAGACGSRKPMSIYVPPGRFFVSQVLFQGPCNNQAVRIIIHGTIVATAGYDSSTKWFYLKNVDGVSIFGGTFEGNGQSLWACKMKGGSNGQSLWACKMKGGSCPIGATTLTIGSSKNVLISGLTSLNSKLFHISIQKSSAVTIRNAKISAPGSSPNTDGIQIQMSDGVTITGSVIGTGDDCISMKEGAANVWIENVGCGPGHGISIGSLGTVDGAAWVRNVTVKSVMFTGTQNGVRIKTWAMPTKSFVTAITFRHVVMKDVQNPIIIDQNYCPDNTNCPNQSSGIKISQVSFSDIVGSSATKVAMSLDCSRSNPCSGIELRNIRLTFGNQQAQSFCRNVGGSASGFVVPPSCL